MRGWDFKTKYDKMQGVRGLRSFILWLLSAHNLDG